MKVTERCEPDTTDMVGECRYCRSKAEADCSDPELQPGLDGLGDPFAHATCPVCGVRPPGGMFFRKRSYSGIFV